jgi:hypothetical protein
VLKPRQAHVPRRIVQKRRGQKRTLASSEESHESPLAENIRSFRVGRYFSLASLPSARFLRSAVYCLIPVFQLSLFSATN